MDINEELKSTKDIDLIFKRVAELRNLCRSLHFARLENEREELMAKFRRYLKQREEISNSDPDAILLGFWDAYKNEEYNTILRIGNMLTKEYLFQHKEIGALYGDACRRMKHNRER